MSPSFVQALLTIISEALQLAPAIVTDIKNLIAEFEGTNTQNLGNQVTSDTQSLENQLKGA